MKNSLLEKLKKWRALKAQQQNREVFKVLHSSCLEEIARKKPQTKEGFLAIKGLGEKKWQQYGQELLIFTEEERNGSIEEKEIFSKQTIEQEVSVGDFLSVINQNLGSQQARVRGEISQVKNQNGYSFFTLKDAQEESAMNCFLWERDRKLSSVELEEGREVIVTGHSQIYKPRGTFSFQTQTIEWVGEGALKKAYEELKERLQREGFFDLERKKELPVHPQKIGLITSREGAVISDFLNNIGQFGFQISFVNSRVEGQLAVKELMEAVRCFEKKKIDCLVIIRGGGSLESLQAFNNENLVRAISQLDFPVICGIGHDQDVPLFSLVADQAVSTPTAVAQLLNRSWEESVQRLSFHQQKTETIFAGWLERINHRVEKVSQQAGSFFSSLEEKVDFFEKTLKGKLKLIEKAIFLVRKKIDSQRELIGRNYQKNLQELNQRMMTIEKTILANNPERQLRLGYSLIFQGEKIVKSVQAIKIGQSLTLKLSDGKARGKIESVDKN